VLGWYLIVLIVCSLIVLSLPDVNEDNVFQLLSQYTQAYPPNDDSELLLSWAGTHWRRDDPSVSLPKPRKDHVLLVEQTSTVSNGETVSNTM
jgi:hypothetical protein